MKGVGFKMQFCLSVELRKLLLANEFEGSFGKPKPSETQFSVATFT